MTESKNISIKAPKATPKGKSPTPKKYLHIANITQCHKYKEYESFPIHTISGIENSFFT